MCKRLQKKQIIIKCWTAVTTISMSGCCFPVGYTFSPVSCSESFSHRFLLCPLLASMFSVTILFYLGHYYPPHIPKMIRSTFLSLYHDEFLHREGRWFGFTLKYNAKHFLDVYFTLGYCWSLSGWKSAVEL